MKTWISHRATLAALAAGGLLAALGLWLAVASSADTQVLTLSATNAGVGQSIHANVQLAEAPDASGEISFEVFGPGDPSCSGPALAPAPASATVAGEGEYSSGAFSAEEAGTYHWSAHYTGDLDNPPADAECAAASVVSKATPGLTGSASDATVNAAIHDEVTVSDGFSAGGEVVFKVFAPGDNTCATPLASSSGTIAGGHASSQNYLPQQAGEFRWTAEYTGDGNNAAVSLDCGAPNQASTVGKATPGLTGTATSGQVGSSVTDSVTLASGFSPSGSIRFRAFGPGDTSCSGSVQYEESVTVSGNGPYSPAGFTPATAGSYRWTVEYEGDANNATASLPCGSANQTSTLSKASPGLAGTATSAQVGSTVTDNVTVSNGSSPGGELHFRAYAPGDSTCSGSVEYEATVTVSGNGAYAPAGFAPGAGSYRWKVEYTGDANNQATSLSCGSSNQTSTVSKAAPGLAGTAGSAQVGSAITDTVTVSSGFNPGGELRFRAYAPGDTSCSGSVQYEESVTVSGNGPYSPTGFTPASAGSYHWKVDYTGDTDNSATSLACGATNQTSTVSKAAPGLTGTATSGPVGSSITDNVTLSSGFSPSGSLRFRAYAPGDTSCTGTVQYDKSVTVSGNGPYSPAGFTPPGAGSYRWKVEYEGDANNATASLPCGSPNQTSIVGKASPGLTGTAGSGAAGSTISDSVTLADGSSGASGNLHFRAYGPGDLTCSGAVKYDTTVPVSGNGAYSPPGFMTGVGSYRWKVEYSGDTNNDPAELACGAPNQTSTVSKAAPALSGTASSGQIGATITDSVSFSGGFSPSGELHFRAYGPGDSSCSGTVQYEEAVQVSANTSYSPAGFAPGAGSYRWKVEYTGDTNNQAASLPCGSANQESVVSKAAPTLTGSATSVQVGSTITDQVTIAGGSNPGGDLHFRAYGAGDPSCSGTPSYEETVAVSGDGVYTPTGFAPSPGLYHWRVDYTGDSGNDGASLSCAAPGQASAVGMINVKLSASASSATVGNPIAATATLREGTNPSGQISFAAYAPTDGNCSGTPSFTSSTNVVGNGTYHSSAFVPARVGSFRWVVSYSGDTNHAATKTGCGAPASNIAQAKPSIASTVPQELSVGTPFQITATLQGGFAPTGTVSFRIYGPNASSCGKALSTNTVSVSANGTVSSAPFVALAAGRYLFVASYSGNANNQALAESCDPNGRVAVVGKRAPKVKPAARLKGKRISIRARLLGATSPTGTIRFRLYRPGNKTCQGKPAFSGGVTVKANGRYLLAQYLAKKRGVYRLAVTYSGDKRNQRYDSGCAGAQQIRVG